MLSRIKTDINYLKLINESKKLGYSKFIELGKDFYTTVEALIKSRALIVCNGEVMYIEEICFDYKNGEIYVPYIECNYAHIDSEYYTKFRDKGLLNKYWDYRIAYNNKIQKYMIYANGKYTLDKLDVIVRIQGEVQLVSINIKDMPLRDTTSTDKSAQSLFDRYLAFCYGLVDETDYDLFYEFKKSKITRIEQEILKRMGLEWYGEYTDHKYNDVRSYKVDNLIECFNQDRLQIDEDYNIRRFRFEAELMTRLEEKDYWINWSKGSIGSLVKGYNYFCKFKEQNVSFIFKREWLRVS